MITSYQTFNERRKNRRVGYKITVAVWILKKTQTVLESRRKSFFKNSQAEYESLPNARISTRRQDNSVSKVRGDMKVIYTDLL